VVPAKNDVQYGIQIMTAEMKQGNLFICEECKNLIREVESYVWDSKYTERGEDEPLKKDDHSVDALRYAVATHKVSTFDVNEYNRKHDNYMRDKYYPGNYGFR
jgi:phage terminase large subunit